MGTRPDNNPRRAIGDEGRRIEAGGEVRSYNASKKGKSEKKM